MAKQLALLLTLISTSAGAQFNMIETKYLRLVSYDFGHAYILPHAGRCFQNALDFHQKLFDYIPSEKITVLLQDFGDFGNGGATAIPKNAITIGMAPFSYAFETSPAGERMFSMMNHELAHVVALDNSTKADRFYKRLFFGKVNPTKDQPISMFYSFLTSPRRYSPRWYHEGIASYVETWMGGGVGLALGSYDEMVFRTKVLENSRIYTAEGLESEGTTTDFQGKSNSYLYGTRFMGYLAYQYGPEKIIDWVKRKEGSKRFYLAQFQHVFGKPLNDGWNDWIEFERNWQKKNIDSLSKNPITQTTRITKKVLGSVSFAHFDEKRNKIYVAVNYPGQVPHLAALNLKDGSTDKLTDIKGAALFYVSAVAYDPEGDMIYFTTDNDAWRDLNSYNILTRKVKRLQKDFRVGDLAFNKSDKSIWGIKHMNGLSTITRIPRQDPENPQPRPYGSWEQKYTLPYGQDIFDIDISPDGKKLSAAVSDLKGNQSLLIYDMEKLSEGVAQIDTLFNFEVSSPQSFRFTQDGNYLYGSSYFSGVSNIFRVNLATKEVSPISNAVTGLFRPLPIDEEKLFAFNFTSDGFQPVYIDNKPVDSVSSIEFLGNATIEKQPVLKEWELSPPQQKDSAAVTIKNGKYEPWKLFRANYAYPTVVGYKNFVGVGYKINFSDPLSFKELDISFSYTPRSWVNGMASESDSSNLSLTDTERYHFTFFGRLGRYSFGGSYNLPDFYDLFGPTRVSRKGGSVRLDYNTTLINNPPQVLNLTLGASVFHGLQKSPEFQQIEVTGYDQNFFINTDGSLSYSYLKSSLGAVDPEKGTRSTLRYSSSLSANKLYVRVMATLDHGFQLPVHHSSIWLRTAVGNSFNDIINPFSRFAFAAFGNNYIDYQANRRYRTTFSFPGLSYHADQSVIAKSFGKGMIEFVLPPIRFREFGAMNLYSNWIQATLFSSALFTADGTSQSYRFINAGSQVDMKIVIFSLLESTFSIGYANAWDLNDHSKRYKEWMVSLKLLR